VTKNKFNKDGKENFLILSRVTTEVTEIYVRLLFCLIYTEDLW